MNIIKLALLALLLILINTRNLQQVASTDTIDLATLEDAAFLAQVNDAVARTDSGESIVSVLMSLDQSPI